MCGIDGGDDVVRLGADGVELASTADERERREGRRMQRPGGTRKAVS